MKYDQILTTEYGVELQQPKSGQNHRHSDSLNQEINGICEAPIKAIVPGKPERAYARACLARQNFNTSCPGTLGHIRRIC